MANFRPDWESITPEIPDSALGLVRQLKPIQNLVMASLPALGYMLGLPCEKGVGGLGLVFLILCAFCMFAAVRIYEEQSQSGLSNSFDQPLSPGKLYILMFALSLLIVVIGFRQAGLTWAGTFLAFTLYSNGKTNLKHVPIVSTLLFFVTALLAFATGLAAANALYADGLLLGIFFATVFCVGQLCGEIISLHFDKAFDQNSNAVTFGPGRVFSFAFTLLTGAFVLLIILVVGKIVSPMISAPFLGFYVLLALVYLKVGRDSNPQNVLLFQFAYRTLFLVGAVTAFVIKAGRFDC